MFNIEAFIVFFSMLNTFFKGKQTIKRYLSYYRNKRIISIKFFAPCIVAMPNTVFVYC